MSLFYPCRVVLGSFEESGFGMITAATARRGSCVEQCLETVRPTRSGFFLLVRIF